MYRPNFTITKKILNHIAEISASREVILNAPLLPKWEAKLRKEAILKMAHHFHEYRREQTHNGRG